MEIALVSVLVTIAIIAVALKKRKEMAFLAILDSLEEEVASAVALQRSLLDFESGYLMKKDWIGAIKSSRPLLEKIKSVPEEIREAHPKNNLFKELIENHANKKLRKTRNEKFKAHELEACDAMLSDIGGKSLDAQQRNAVVTDEYNNLVVAGAGSGKTLTVVGKIKYLVERRGVKPEEILVTSFTRKSVEELKDRIEKAGVEGVSCKTFHKIGLDRLGKVGVANENELRSCVMQYLRETILSHPNQMSSYIEFYGCYRHVPKEPSQYACEGERLRELKATDLTTIKGLLTKAKSNLDTIQGERVKSLEELMIANFLFLNGVTYEYERNYKGKYETEGRAYQPDFYLPDYDIWLEHFGVDEHGRCPWMAAAIEEQKYIEGMEWKRAVHAQNGTRLIESYSYWNKDHDLLSKLRTLLEENGVELGEDDGMLSDVYRCLGADDGYLRSVSSLISTFLSLTKANNASMTEVSDWGREAYKGDGYMWHRFELFMTFTEPIMDLYQQTLADKGQVDFDDMINAAADKIASEGIGQRFTHIIVDEYQDISKSRFALIEAIRNACGARLMCVGDDWQSIYRFAGSDVSLFTGFGDHVGYHETMKIERTYRNSQELVGIASKFIESNPAQIHKEMRSDKHEETPVVICFDSSMASGLERSLSNIAESQKDAAGSVLVLGRHNFDIETAYPDFKGKDSYSNDRVSLKRNRKTGDVKISFPGLEDIIFMSVHRAKGLEADNVVVLNLTNEMYGFPNRVEDDPILGILLDGNDTFELAEERRLFYVAITRTRKDVFLISSSTDSGHGPSPFVDELMGSRNSHTGILQEESESLWNPAFCPRCGTGRLVVRKNPQSGKSFLGCTNYPFCERSYGQVEILEDKLKCPSCKGWMVRRRRTSDGNPFFGCSNWPDCTATIDATDDYEPVCPSPESQPGYFYSYSRLSNLQNSPQGGGRSPKRCPRCGASMKLLRNSKDGSVFYGCMSYPSCSYTCNAEMRTQNHIAMKCPRCGAPLKELTNRKDGSVFYGCTRYPECGYTKNK